MGRPTQILSVSTFLLGGLCSALAASDADLLRILEQKGYLSASEVAELRASSAAEKAGSGVVITTPAKHVVNLEISGALQFQYDGISASHGIKGTNQVGFRHLFLGISATLPNDWYVRGAFDFAGNTGGAADGGTGVLDHMFLGWKNSKELDVKVGYGKVPFGYETTTGPLDVLTIEASPAANYFADVMKFNSFHAGAWVNGDLDGGFSYTAALANGNQGYRGNGGNGYSVWGRGQYTTDVEQIGGTLMVGLDLGYQNKNETFDARSIFGYSIYARADIGQLALITEFTGATVEGGQGNSRTNPFGVTATATYRIEQFQPVFQYGFVESSGFAGIDPAAVIYAGPSDASVQGTNALYRMHSVYLGSNYYLLDDNIRVSAGLIYMGAPASEGASYDAVGARAQVQVQF